MRRLMTAMPALALAGLGLAAAGVGGAVQAPARAEVPRMVVGAAGQGAHVVAVGDIAKQGGPYDQTAALARELGPERVLLAGDTVYESGTPQEYQALFDPSWGGFRPIWLPVPGNHEYRTSKAAGYRDYFDEAGGLYWSRAVGTWRIIGLDSERVGSAAQRKWLKRTLKKYDGTPTLVMWHRPRYSTGEHADQANTARLYNLVRRDPDVKLLVWGHDHDYERMGIPVSGRAAALPAFVVGTGGAELRCDRTAAARTWSAFFDCRTYGVLDLRLAPRSFSWAYVTTDGATLDAGSRTW